MRHRLFIAAALCALLLLGLAATFHTPVSLGKPTQPLTVLYDQYNNVSSYGETLSTYSVTYNNMSAQGADDFVVPANQTWYIQQVEVAGQYISYPVAQSVNVFWYTTAGILPGTPVLTQTNILPTGGVDTGNFVITLPGPVVLPTGHYWVSVQANEPQSGLWYWYNRNGQANQAAAWRAPIWYTSTACADWGRRMLDCGNGYNDPDQVFRLSGILGGPLPTATPIPTDTAIPLTDTPVPASPTPTSPPATPTIGPGCLFSDVCPPDYFFTPVQYLVNHGAISGYSDQTFRPSANTTRGQLSKIIVAAEGWAINTAGGPHFSDVPPDQPFYNYVETAVNHGIISGYADGTFRPSANVTRGQLSKIIVGAQGWSTNIPPVTQSFNDVPSSNTFWSYIEAAYSHGIISGYNCGGTGEVCPGTYFRPTNNATRGQIAKIVYLAVTYSAPR